MRELLLAFSVSLFAITPSSAQTAEETVAYFLHGLELGKVDAPKAENNSIAGITTSYVDHGAINGGKALVSKLFLFDGNAERMPVAAQSTEIVSETPCRYRVRTIGKAYEMDETLDFTRARFILGPAPRAISSEDAFCVHKISTLPGQTFQRCGKLQLLYSTNSDQSRLESAVQYFKDNVCRGSAF